MQALAEVVIASMDERITYILCYRTGGSWLKCCGIDGKSHCPMIYGTDSSGVNVATQTLSDRY